MTEVKCGCPFSPSHSRYNNEALPVVARGGVYIVGIWNLYLIWELNYCSTIVLPMTILINLNVEAEIQQHFVIWRWPMGITGAQSDGYQDVCVLVYYNYCVEEDTLYGVRKP